jgi:hypothetical protein
MIDPEKSSIACVGDLALTDPQMGKLGLLKI